MGYLRRLASELGVERDVYLLGYRKNPFKYMRRSTLFCLTSLHEGFPNVLVEALACGLPAASSDCLAGPREILAPNTRYRYLELREPEYAEYGVLMPVMDGRYYSARHPLTWQEEVWAEEIARLLSEREHVLRQYRERAAKRALDFEAAAQVRRFIDAAISTYRNAKH